MTAPNTGFATAFSRDPTELKSALTLHELKQKAMAYYAQNGVLGRMEDIVNSTFYDQPNDIYGHLANYFEQWQLAPTLARLKARRALDSQGTQTVQVDVYAVVKNVEEYVSTLTYANESSVFDHAKADEVLADENARGDSLARAIELLSASLSQATQGTVAYDQATIDTKLAEQFAQDTAEEQGNIDAQRQALLAAEAQSAMSAASAEAGGKPQKKPADKGAKRSGKKELTIVKDEPREQLPVGFQALGAASLAACVAGAKLLHVPLFSHVANLAEEMCVGRVDERQGPRKYRLPLPITTLLYSGKAAAGKQNLVKEYAVVPRWTPVFPAAPATNRVNSGSGRGPAELAEAAPEPWFAYRRSEYDKCLFDAAALHTQLLRNMQVKQGPAARYVNEFGALCPSFDKLEQGVDLISEALGQKELKERFGVVLTCAAHEIFDYEKGKYEVATGMLKTGEELVDLYADLVAKNPMIVGLVDPFRKVERANWLKLAEKVGQQCFLIGDSCYSPSWRLLQQPLTAQHQDVNFNFGFTNAASVRLSSRNTVSDLLRLTQTLRNANNVLIVSSCRADSGESYDVDLAVGLGAEFVRLGAPTRGERVAKVNRLLQIAEQLDADGRLLCDSTDFEPIAFNKLYAIQENERQLALVAAETAAAEAAAAAAAAANTDAPAQQPTA